MPARGVMLLIADDWSPLAGCYGNEAIHTPHIDALAQRGTRFDHAFCTTPSCAASRANILTGYYSHQHGQYGHSHGIHGFRTHEWIRSVPASLDEARIPTGLIGKAHVLPAPVYPFQQWEFRDPTSNDSMAEGVADFLRTAADRPFFLHAASVYPHRAGGQSGTSTFPADRAGEEFASKDRKYDPADVIVPNFIQDSPRARRDLADYYRYVTRYDDFVGRAVTELERAGRSDDTLILVMSDHGMPFPGAKGSPYEGGHHCPLIVIDPRAPGRGSACSALVNWSDIAPTIYDWLGVEEKHRPGDLPGRSLLPILDQERPEGWDQTFYSHSFHGVNNYFPYRILRERRYKYVRNVVPELPMPLPSDLFASPTWQDVRDRGLKWMGERPVEGLLHHDPEELFDLEQDPAETQNLIDEPALKETVRRMRQEVREFRRRTRDPWLEYSRQAGEPV